MKASSTRERMLLGTGVSLIALMAAHGALAEAAPTALAEVVVTAQKRTEALQEVPASVSAMSGDLLQQRQLTQLADYSAYVPGLNVASGGTPGQAAVTLRGIAPVGPGAVVGTYIDDTPVGSSANYARATIFALDLMPYDLERLEVLRGPQGTLYGAGAMGGLLKYVLRSPSLNHFEGRVGVEGSSTSGADDPSWGVRGRVDAPLIPGVLGVSLSAFDQRSAGYIDNAFTGARNVNRVSQYGGRVAALWNPTDNLSVKLNAMWQTVDAKDAALVSSTRLTAEKDPSDAYIVDGPPNFGRLSESHAFAQPFRKSIDFYSATANWDLGGFNLISATSLQHAKTHQVTDASLTFGGFYPLVTDGAVPAGLNLFTLDLDLQKVTQEVRVVSPQGRRVEWIAGAFFTHERSRNHQTSVAMDNAYKPIPEFSPEFLFASLPTTYQEYALFGDVTLKLTAALDVTGGVRYAHNDQKFRQISGGAILPPADAAGKSSEGVTTWMGSARYHFAPDVMAYARVATGFRPGGPNVVLPGIPPAVSSDTLTNYEAGLKSEFLDHRVLLNIAAFDIEWRNIQLLVANGGVNHLENVGDAKSRGVELEAAVSPVGGLRLGVSAAYTDAKLTAVTANGPPVVLGRQLPGVPKWSASLTADYNTTLPNGWEAHLGGAYRYVDEEFTGPVMITAKGGAPVQRLPSYSLADLNGSVSSGPWTARLFVRNLFDKRGYSGGGVITDPFNAAAQADYAIVQPRTIGLALDLNF
jgi:outer membrane receptor protein involved in Fe transport